MNLLEDDSAVMGKTRDLCETIANDSDYRDLLQKVEKFLGDDEARLSYQSVHESGQALNQKQQSGLQLSDSEIAEFEGGRTELLNNPIASDFMQAQQSLEALQSSVSRMVGMTLELGRVPTPEDIAQASGGGCCGGGGESEGEGGGGG
ncbi:MAG: YlbF family regulator [Verrucomicrobia bacterium]|nr:YlbF family regulator [Verrucomicrobiota bacterium]